MISIKQDEKYLHFANTILNSGLQYPNCVSFTNLNDKEEILAVVVFYNFSKYSCDVAVASESPRACTRGFIDVCLHYVFETAKLARITCITDENNKRTIKLAKGLGCKEEGRLSNMFGDSDGLLFGLTKASAKRWIRDIK